VIAVGMLGSTSVGQSRFLTDRNHPSVILNLIQDRPGLRNRFGSRGRYANVSPEISTLCEMSGS
jgi:hypothetical protein